MGNSTAGWWQSQNPPFCWKYASWCCDFSPQGATCQAWSSYPSCQELDDWFDWSDWTTRADPRVGQRRRGQSSERVFCCQQYNSTLVGKIEEESHLKNKGSWLSPRVLWLCTITLAPVPWAFCTNLCKGFCFPTRLWAVKCLFNYCHKLLSTETHHTRLNVEWHGKAFLNAGHTRNKMLHYEGLLWSADTYSSA